MAKRKRLEVAQEPVSFDLETKPAVPISRARMPIADVAGDTAGRAALEEVAREMTSAETEGRVVKKLPLARIEVHHLARDRMVLDEDEMEALKSSIEDRGQQTPIEVVALGNGMFGLISGMRRIKALQALGATDALALVKKPETSQDAYVAMTEENEIRANLSFYERAHIAYAAVEQRVFPDPKAAVKELFAHAPKAKRSKILKFVTLCETLGPTLAFPHAIPEHLGLKLAQAIEADRSLAGKVVTQLKKSPPLKASDERRVLEAALKGPTSKTPMRTEITPGLSLEGKAGRVVLAGKAVDSDFLEALRGWIMNHTGF